MRLMNRLTTRLMTFLVLTLLAISQVMGAEIDPSKDWPAWRGPTRDGLAFPYQTPPIQWDESRNVLWKSKLPGRGHGSPTVVGDFIYLATSDPATGSQSVLCLERASGKQIWTTVVHPDRADPGRHAHSSAASSTVTCDGQKLYINFLNAGAVLTSALDLKGKLLWQKKICEYVVHQGFGSSPVLHESNVIVSADHRGGGVVVALNRDTGNLTWTVPRPTLPNYTTPAVLQVAGKTQMVMAGCNLITSLDPVSGKKLWELDGSTEECVVTAVTDGKRVFVSGGYPKNHTVAIEGDGSRRVSWQNTARVYVPSMIQKEGHLYAVMDAGLAVCWKSATGEELWKERLGGDFFASPVMVGNRIYASNVGGKTFVFEATPDKFTLLAQNQLGREAYASPVICGNRIYLRIGKQEDQRQEWLYCIADVRSASLNLKGNGRF